jgi:hypothetical protein
VSAPPQRLLEIGERPVSESTQGGWWVENLAQLSV